MYQSNLISIGNVYAIYRLHNLLIDMKDMQELSTVESGMGYFGSQSHCGNTEQDRSLDAPALPLGFDSKIHPQDKFHMEV